MARQERRSLVPDGLAASCHRDAPSGRGARRATVPCCRAARRHTPTVARRSGDVLSRRGTPRLTRRQPGRPRAAADPRQRALSPTRVRVVVAGPLGRRAGHARPLRNDHRACCWNRMRHRGLPRPVGATRASPAAPQARQIRRSVAHARNFGCPSRPGSFRRVGAARAPPVGARHHAFPGHRPALKGRAESHKPPPGADPCAPPGTGAASRREAAPVP
jgi:hypothetical protein